MNSDDIQKLSAYMDDELAPDEQEALDQRLAEDAEFRKLLQQLRQQELYLRASVNTIENAPIKPELVSLLTEDSDDGVIADSTVKVVSLFRYRIKRMAAAGIPIAAMLLLATVFVFDPDSKQPSQDYGRVAGETLSAEISAVLENLVAGQEQRLTEGRLVREVLAFKRKDGALCKHFVEQQAQAAYAAVACREHNTWVTQVSVLAEPQELKGEQQFIPADGSGSAIDKYIEQNIDGTSLTVEQELQE